MSLVSLLSTRPHLNYLNVDIIAWVYLWYYMIFMNSSSSTKDKVWTKWLIIIFNTGWTVWTRESEKRISSLLTTTILPKWKLLTDYSLSLALAHPLCLKDHHCRCIGISFSSLKCSCTKNFWHFPEAWILVDGSNFPNGAIEKSKSNWKFYLNPFRLSFWWFWFLE